MIQKKNIVNYIVFLFMFILIGYLIFLVIMISSEPKIPPTKYKCIGKTCVVCDDDEPCNLNKGCNGGCNG